MNDQILEMYSLAILTATYNMESGLGKQVISGKLDLTFLPRPLFLFLML